MHVSKVGLPGQIFALATSDDSGGRKSRIRRSKEERKSMVESFIKKYQKSNNGNFPSLNLTHKEVGGSFYTVREIVREIIQENRVLAPPKVPLEEDGHSRFLEQHPLGSISMEPPIDLSVSGRVHMVAHILPNEYQISNEEDISSSNGSYTSELDNEQIIDGVSKVACKDKGSDITSKSHHAPNHCQDKSKEYVSSCRGQSPQPKTQEFEDKKIVNGSEVLDGSPDFDEPLVKNVDHQDNIDSAIPSSEKLSGLGSQRFSDEPHYNKNEQTVDKTEEFGQRIHTERAVMETLDREKLEAQNVEISQAIKPHTNSDVVVEKFPLRPVPGTVHDMDGESGELQEAAATVEDKAIQHEKKTFTQSTSVFVREKGEEKLPDLTVEMSRGEYGSEKVVLNLQGPAEQNVKCPSASKPSLLVTELESKARTNTLISEDSTAVVGKSSDQDHSSLSKGNNPSLDRINLETWEGASKKSTRPESNPLLALVKAFISSFVKFWTE